MTPIDENELRAELQDTSYDAWRPDTDLAADAIRRGRDVRRRRATVGTVASVAVLGTAVWGFGSVLADRPSELLPAGTGTVATSVSPTPSTTAPSQTATPTPTTTTPTPSPTSVTTTPQPPLFMALPADVGTWPARWILPDEDRPAKDETTAYLPQDTEIMCSGGKVELSLIGLERSRVRALTGPEFYDGMGLLQFADEAAAQAFMDELATKAAECPDPNQENTEWRGRHAVSSTPGLGDEALVVRLWNESKDEAGVWQDSIGGGLQLFVREGRSVAFVATGGESLGDPIEEVTRADSRVRPKAEAILADAP